MIQQPVWSTEAADTDAPISKGMAEFGIQRQLQDRALTNLLREGVSQQELQGRSSDTPAPGAAAWFIFNSLPGAAEGMFQPCQRGFQDRKQLCLISQLGGHCLIPLLTGEGETWKKRG